MRTLVVAGPGKPSEPELRRRIAEDLMPDVVSAEDAVGATMVDDRYFAAMPGLRGRVMRRLPLLAAQAIEVFIRCHRYDAVVTWADKAGILIGATLRLRPGRPGHVAILMWPSSGKKAQLVRLAVGGIDRFLVWPPLQRRFLERTVGVPSDRFIDAYAPTDTDFWRPSEGPTDMICSVGQEMRDYGTLLRALRALEIPCHIAAGTGLFNARFLQDEWNENVGDQPLPTHVTFGRKSLPELRELYGRSRFVVIPLRPADMDNGITVIIEAFSMGKTVICTETEGQVGLLEHDVNCLRVPAGDDEALRDAIVELWNDPDKCDRLGAAGRAEVLERHGIPRWRATLVQAVEEAAAVRRRR